MKDVANDSVKVGRSETPFVWIFTTSIGCRNQFAFWPDDARKLAKQIKKAAKRAGASK